MSEKRITTADRLRRESTARRVHRRIVLIANEDGVALACPACGGRGEQSPLESMHGVYPPVGSPCGTVGCDGTVQEITLAEADARLAEGIRQ